MPPRSTAPDCKRGLVPSMIPGSRIQGSRRSLVRYLFAVLLAMASLHAQTNSMRPQVLGLAHVAFRVGDAGKARAFYEGFLGYQEPFSLKDENGRLTVAYM